MSEVSKEQRHYEPVLAPWLIAAFERVRAQTEGSHDTPPPHLDGLKVQGLGELVTVAAAAGPEQPS